MDIGELYDVIDQQDPKKLYDFMKANDLYLENGKLVAKDKNRIHDFIEYWDKRQLVRKIMLNSV